LHFVCNQILWSWSTTGMPCKNKWLLFWFPVPVHCFASLQLQQLREKMS